MLKDGKILTDFFHNRCRNFCRNHLLFFCFCLYDNVSVGSDDLGITDVGAVGRDVVYRKNISLIFDGPCTQQCFPVFVANGRPGSLYGKCLSALGSGFSKFFGESQVVADGCCQGNVLDFEQSKFFCSGKKGWTLS